MAVEQTKDQEKLAMEALEEIGGGGIIDKIKNMSAAKKAALGTILAAAFTATGDQLITGGKGRKWVVHKLSGLVKKTNTDSNKSEKQTFNYPSAVQKEIDKNGGDELKTIVIKNKDNEQTSPPSSPISQ